MLAESGAGVEVLTEYGICRQDLQHLPCSTPEGFFYTMGLALKLHEFESSNYEREVLLSESGLFQKLALVRIFAENSRTKSWA